MIKPTAGGGLTNALADYETSYGKVSSHWKLEGDNFSLDVEIPVNTTATVYIPITNSNDVIYESGVSVAAAPGIKMATPETGYMVVNVGSGNYHFLRTAIKTTGK